MYTACCPHYTVGGATSETPPLCGLVVGWFSGPIYTGRKSLTFEPFDTLHSSQCKLASEERGTAVPKGSQVESHADVNQLPK